MYILMAWMSASPLMGVCARTARYINHACDPNCHTEQFGHTIWIVAIRDIAAGEELTFNYGYGIDDEPVVPCHCGAKHCCGYILGPQYWDRIKQRAPW